MGTSRSSAKQQKEVKSISQENQNFFLTELKKGKNMKDKKLPLFW